MVCLLHYLQRRIEILEGGLEGDHEERVYTEFVEIVNDGSTAAVAGSTIFLSESHRVIFVDNGSLGLDSTNFTLTSEAILRGIHRRV